MSVTLQSFRMRQDQDRRLQAAVGRLADFTGPEAAWLRRFLELVDTDEGEAQLPGLWLNFMQQMMGSPSYGETMPMVLRVQCTIPLEKVSYAPDKLSILGDTLIFETVVQTSNVPPRSDTAVIANNIGNLLVQVLESEIRIQ